MTTAPHSPPRTIGRLGARLRTPGRRTRSLEACRGVRSSPPAAPKASVSIRILPRRGLCAFAFEYLIGVHERRSLRSAAAALTALAPYDPVARHAPTTAPATGIASARVPAPLQPLLLPRATPSLGATYGWFPPAQVLAAQWRVLLERTEEPHRLDGLSLSDLHDVAADGAADGAAAAATADGAADGADNGAADAPLSEANVAGAVLAGCRAKLLGARRRELDALREVSCPCATARRGPPPPPPPPPRALHARASPASST